MKQVLIYLILYPITGLIIVMVFLYVTESINKFFRWIIDLANENKPNKYQSKSIYFKKTLIFYGLWFVLCYLGIVLYYILSNFWQIVNSLSTNNYYPFN